MCARMGLPAHTGGDRRKRFCQMTHVDQRRTEQVRPGRNVRRRGDEEVHVRWLLRFMEGDFCAAAESSGGGEGK